MSLTTICCLDVRKIFFIAQKMQRRGLLNFLVAIIDTSTCQYEYRKKFIAPSGIQPTRVTLSITSFLHPRGP